MKKKEHITRDTTWLSFNERVLQESNDNRNTLYERLRFLGIFSNNLDEFYRVRIAALTNLHAVQVANKKIAEAKNSADLLQQIAGILAEQQIQFDEIANAVFAELRKIKIFINDGKELTTAQLKYLEEYFEEYVRNDIMPIMIESVTNLPPLRDKNLYLACILGSASSPLMQTYALIEIPSSTLGRFVLLPSAKNEKHYILLEEVVRLFIPKLFAQFGFSDFDTSIIKITKDADVDFDAEIGVDVVERITKGIKHRKKGVPMRFIYEKGMDKRMLKYLTSLLKVNNKNNIVSGGRIHNFKDFIDFPTDGFKAVHQKERIPSFIHPLFKQPKLLFGELDKQDVMLHFPYHSFDSIIDLLKEASIDPYVTDIKITAYRLAKNSKVVKALINAVRNGKQVHVILELKARFDEEANLKWKIKLEEEGVKVYTGKPNMKVHAKICLITKVQFNRVKHYGFISTGNINERTATVYSDHCLLTANSSLLKEVGTLFNYLIHPRAKLGDSFKHLVNSPLDTRKTFLNFIDAEIKQHKQGKAAGIIVKLNNLSDELLIEKLQSAVKAGVSVQLIIRGAFCLPISPEKKPANLKAISIIDNYLEHARVFYFVNHGKPKVYISSADWMRRNLDYRIETTIPIYQKNIQQEILEILQLQLSENVKARILNSAAKNEYVQPSAGQAIIQSQKAVYEFIKAVTYG